MADFTNAPTLTPTATPTPGLSAASANLVPVQVTVESASPALLAVNRPMMMEATPAEIVGARSLTLATVLGELKVALQSHSAPQVQQDLLRELMSLIETKKTLTLSLQSGAIGTPGLLLVPVSQTAAKAALTPTAQPTAAGLAPSQQPPQIMPGAARATPLPPAQSGLVITVLPLPPAALPGGAPTPAPPVPQQTTLATGAEPPPAAVATTNMPAREPEAVLLSRANKLYSHAPAALATPTQTTDHPAQAPQATTISTAPPPAGATITAPAAPAVVGYLSTLYRTLVGVPQMPPASPPAATAPQPTSVTAPPPEPAATAALTGAPATPPDTAAPKLSATAAPSAPQTVPSPPSATIPQPTATATQPPPMPTSAPPLTESPPSPAGTPAAPAPMPAASTQPPVALPVGKDVSLRIVSVQPPQTAAASVTPPPLHPGQFVATVIAQTPDGRLLAQAGANVLYVRNEITAPVGATLILQPAAPSAAGVGLPAVPSASYKALPDILNILQQMDVLTAPRLIASLPQANDGLAGALLQIFGSYKSADPAAWLGRPVAETLAHLGQAELLRSLSREMKEQTRAGSDPIVGDWRSYPVPLYNAGAFHTLTLHVHHDRDKSSDREHESTGKKTRFLVDMRLSRLGDLQLDGFVQPKKIDMVLRSERSLPDGVHAELRAAYGKAMGAVGFAGTLNFQIGRQHWVRVTGDTRGGLVT